MPSKRRWPVASISLESRGGKTAKLKQRLKRPIGKLQFRKAIRVQTVVVIAPKQGITAFPE